MIDLLTVSKLLFVGCAENKKALEAETASRTSACAPWYHLDSRASSRRRPLEVQTHFCAVTGAPVVTYALSSRPRDSKTMFPGPFRASSHQTRLSVPYLPGYSSLHRLCVSGFRLPVSLHGEAGPVNGYFRSERAEYGLADMDDFHKDDLPAANFARKFYGSTPHRIATVRQNCYHTCMISK